MSTQQQQSSILTGSFSLIWYYWYKKYMLKKTKKTILQQQLSQLKQKYCIESISIQNQNNHNIALLLRKKIQQIKQKTNIPSNLVLQSSSLSATSTTSTITTLISPPHYYTINPQLQSKQIQQTILYSQQYNNQLTSTSTYISIDQQQINQLINQLHSYYLNCKCIFIIYKKQRQNNNNISIVNQLNNTRINKCGNSYQGSLLNSKINLSSLGMNQDDSLGIDRNDSVLDSIDRMQDKIENLQILAKFWQYDGIQIWNVKYYSIPHCFVNIKKNCWVRCLDQLVLHPLQPKTISSLPILPRLSNYKPSIDKLQCFISYMQQLWQKYPTLCPLRQSIFQYNNLPYIFVQDQKQQNIGVLCYYIVYGNQQGNLSQKYIQRWLQNNNNYNSILGKMIRYMQELNKNRNRFNNLGDVGVKGLFDQSDIIW